jgi:hypothetical protein
VPRGTERSAEVDVDSEFSRARTLVEDVIKGLGIEPSSVLAKEVKGKDQSATWTLQRGSAAIVITLADRLGPPKGEVATYLRVVSPVLTLEAGGSHEALFKHVLELNAAGLANAAFGLIDRRLVAVSERPALDLQRAEVDQMVRHLAAVADTYDDRLRKEFGGLPRDSQT